GREFLAERAPEVLELRAALVAPAAQLGGLDLGHRHRLARLPQLALEPELLLRAFAQLGGDVAAILVLRLGQLRGPLIEPLGEAPERVPGASQSRQGAALERDPALELPAVVEALLASALRPLGMATLGGELRLQLGSLDRRARALALALSVALREPAGPARILNGGIQRAASITERRL